MIVKLKENWKFFGVFFILLTFRIFYGLNLDFWNEDEKHIYLLGLEFFSFGQWPYFGPDVIHTQTQIPGALQSFLVGLPFYAIPIPEAPFFLLNILSLIGILLLGYYLYKKFPKQNFLTICFWLSTLPWTLEISTHIYNPSYLLLPSIVFFIGFFELVPSFAITLIKKKYAFFFMGLSLGFIMQLHLSWPLLIPFIFFVFYIHRTDLLICCSCFLLGILLPLLLLIPTVIDCGLLKAAAAGTSNSGINTDNLLMLFNNMVRLISYGTYETVMFIGENIDERVDFLSKNILLIPFFGVLTVIGLFQIPAHLYTWWKLFQDKTNLFSRHIIILLIFLFIESWFIFLFSSRPPISRNFYLLLPPILVATYLSLVNIFGDRLNRIMILLATLSLFYHGFVAYIRSEHFPQHSLYSDRKTIVDSIKNKEPHLFESPRYNLKCE